MSESTASQELPQHPYGFDGDDPTWAVAATQKRKAPPVSKVGDFEHRPAADADDSSKPFYPHIPDDFRHANVPESLVEGLILKFLLNIGAASGRMIGLQIALPFRMVESVLNRLRGEQMLAIVNDAALSDYTYELTPKGVERARRYSQQCTYFGATPVALQDYIKAVQKQTVREQQLTMHAIQHAFDGLIVEPNTMRRLGEAMNLGRAILLHGHPGNGKTTVSERMVRAYGQAIWIPRCLCIGGEILRLFDPIYHRQITQSEAKTLGIDLSNADSRWVCIWRPAIIVGGELELRHFDVTTNSVTSINEAPIHLKANCGSLIIDDFGRNRFRPEQLLNRLILPLEKLVDAFHLPSGRTFQVPFDSLVVFSTNLGPETIVDEAFQRRVPFVIKLEDPTPEEYRAVFAMEAERLGLSYEEDVVNYLLNTYHATPNHPLRFSQPRDIALQVRNACDFHQLAPVITRALIDSAVSNLLQFYRSEN
ncbi:MAG: AAA family ATPase [Pirellulaceae bacterium]